MVDIVTPVAPPVPVPALAEPPAITKLDVQKLAQAAALVAPLIPKSWMKSSIILLTIANALQLILASVTNLLPPNIAIIIAVIFSAIIAVVRVVQPNPPIAGGPQDLTTGVKP
jgi:hypothetical protein